ncbi:60S acidic ribosomal protein P1 [Diaporthe helianthi]|uniref:Large ribosomal subunit protein P1 n=1 Tax=Diaporthe helianthi TaxID=158607 RepID=A0A2P5HLA4_DIAHE|nr:60S acidic ribosomal protein P1 [Diaporthe helianthi]
MPSDTTNPETAVSYAALILADEGLEVTPDKLQTLIKAAGVEIEPIWTAIFAKALEHKDVKQLLTSVQVSGPVVTGQVDLGEKVQQELDTEAVTDVCPDGDSDSGSDIGLGLFD